MYDVYTYIRIYVYTYVCMYVCVCLYTYIYIDIPDCWDWDLWRGCGDKGLSTPHTYTHTRTHNAHTMHKQCTHTHAITHTHAGISSSSHTTLHIYIGLVSATTCMRPACQTYVGSGLVSVITCFSCVCVWACVFVWIYMCVRVCRGGGFYLIHIHNICIHIYISKARGGGGETTGFHPSAMRFRRSVL